MTRKTKVSTADSPTTESAEPQSEALGLEEILRLLPPRELGAIATGLEIKIDSAKRIDAPAQLARALLCMPEAREPSRLPAPARELLYRIVEARGVLTVKALPSAVAALVARGLVFARAAGRQAELLVPIAYMMQLKGWEGEDPRGIRRLITQTSPSVQASIASNYLGSPATNPVSLSLETAWRSLSKSDFLRQEVQGLVPAERKLLLRIEELGGEVDTEELLSLEREPMRLRGAGGATQSRRGVGFALERRGFLIPIHPNRHVIPTELTDIIGASRREAAEERREEIRSYMAAEDHCPLRAVFSSDPAPLVLALSAYVRERRVEVKPDLGTPRSLVTRLSNRFGQDSEKVAFLASLCRSLGLWDTSARNANAPPGNLTLEDLAIRCFEVWRQGGGWDEARPEGEVLRAAGAAREQSVVGTVRSIVLESLLALGEGRWIPWDAVAGFIQTDSRAPGLERLLERWAGRCGIPQQSAALMTVAERIVFESLEALGCVDIGEQHLEEGGGRMLRVTSRGRGCLTGAEGEALKDSFFQDVQTLHIESAATVAQVLSLLPFVELGQVERHLEVVVSPASVSSALAEGVEAAVIQRRLSAVAPIPSAVASVLNEASEVRGRGQFVSTSGFLWVDDVEVRETLLARRATCDLFLTPSPPGGLLLANGVDLERVVRRCRTLGVEVTLAKQGAKVAPKSRGTSTSTPESERRTQSGTRRKTGGSTPRSRTAPASGKKSRAI